MGRNIGLTVGLLCLACAACVESMDIKRPWSPERTLGTEIYTELCHRVSSSDHPQDVVARRSRRVCDDAATPRPADGLRLKAMHKNRERLIGALDDLFDEDRIDEIESFLAAIVPLYDNGLMQAQTRGAAALLGDIVDSPPALDALSQLSAREGYRPQRVAPGLIQPALAYPRIEPLSRTLVQAINEGGVAAPAWTALVRTLGYELRNAHDAFAMPEDGTYRVIRDLLLSTDPAFTDGERRYVAARDLRGIAQPRRRADNTFVGPFTDRSDDDDALADVVDGRFVDETGSWLQVASPFAVLGESPVRRDPFDRLLNEDNELVYEYLDTSRTLLGGLLAETRALVAARPTALLDLVGPTRLLLGPPAERQQMKTYPDGSTMEFAGFDVAQSPLLDLTHATALLLDDTVFYSATQLADVLVRQHEGEVANVVGRLRQVAEWSDEPEFADAQLESDSNLLDDLLEVAIDIARVPGLLEDLLEAMQHPQTRRLGGVFAKYMRHTDLIDYDPNDINAPPVGVLETPVNRSQPDTGSNRSVMQRILHLVHDANGSRLCNKEGARLALGPLSYPLEGSYAECELLQIDNAAVFYMQSIVGKAEQVFKDPVVSMLSEIDFLLELNSGIDGLTKFPTPAAINRMLFAPRNEFLRNLIADEAPFAPDGVSFHARHQGTIFAWELHGFFDALRPVVQAFASYDREDLFVDVMSAMHLHWSTPQCDTTQSANPASPGFAHQSGAWRLEGLMAKALDEGDLLGAMAELLAVASALRVDGSNGDQLLVDATRELLLKERTPYIVPRVQNSVAMKTDGVTPVAELAPVWLLKDALTRIDEALDGSPEDKERFEEAVGDLVDQLLEVEQTVDGPRFANRRFVGVLHRVLPFVVDRMRDPALRGDLRSWSEGLTDRAHEGLAHPLVAAGVELLDALRDDSAAREELDAFIDYVLNADTLDLAYDIALTSSADAVQTMMDDTNLAPILETLAGPFEPDGGLVQRAIDFLDEAQQRDDYLVLPRLLGNLVAHRSDGSGELVLQALLDVIVQVNRTNPGSEDTLTPQDYAAVLNTTRELLLDDTRGLERLYEVVANR